MPIRTFGSDPEFLLVKDRTPKSAIAIIQGSPDNRIKVKGHEFYYDNVLAECAIKPGKSKKEVLANVKEAIQIYADMARPFRLTAAASAVFADSELEHEDARKAGCAPDWCAYEIKLKDPPKEAIQNGNSRTCGGHIHIGSELLAADGPEPILAILMLDLFVGVPSLHVDRDPTSVARRRIYGQAGRYRTKDYGVEYRSLSNFWLSSPQLTGLIYDLSMFAVEITEDGRGWDMWHFDEEVFFTSENLADAWTCTAYDTDKIRQGINFSDKEMVNEHFDLALSLMPKGLRSDLEKVIDRPQGSEDNLYANWGIK